MVQVRSELVTGPPAVAGPYFPYPERLSSSRTASHFPLQSIHHLTLNQIHSRKYTSERCVVLAQKHPEVTSSSRSALGNSFTRGSSP